MSCNEGAPANCGAPYIYNGSQLVLSKKINLIDDSEAARQRINCGSSPAGWSQGYRSLKFYPNPNEYSEYERNQSNDVPIFRLADIILTKAEALLLINNLRSVPSSGSPP